MLAGRNDPLSYCAKVAASNQPLDLWRKEPWQQPERLCSLRVAPGRDPGMTGNLISAQLLSNAAECRITTSTRAFETFPVMPRTSAIPTTQGRQRESRLVASQTSTGGHPFSTAQWCEHRIAGPEGKSRDPSRGIGTAMPRTTETAQAGAEREEKMREKIGVRYSRARNFSRRHTRAVPACRLGHLR